MSSLCFCFHRNRIKIAQFSILHIEYAFKQPQPSIWKIYRLVVLKRAKTTFQWTAFFIASAHTFGHLLLLSAAYLMAIN